VYCDYVVIIILFIVTFISAEKVPKSRTPASVTKRYNMVRVERRNMLLSHRKVTVVWRRTGHASADFVV